MMYKGRRFKSVTALREYYGLSKMLYYFRRYAGIPLDAPKGVPGRHAAGVSRVEVVTPDGMSYLSIAAYARALGIHEGAARYRVRSGHLSARPLCRTCEYGGEILQEPRRDVQGFEAALRKGRRIKGGS